MPVLLAARRAVTQNVTADKHGRQIYEEEEGSGKEEENNMDNLDNGCLVSAARDVVMYINRHPCFLCDPRQQKWISSPQLRLYRLLSSSFIRVSISAGLTSTDARSEATSFVTAVFYHCQCHVLSTPVYCFRSIQPDCLARKTPLT